MTLQAGRRKRAASLAAAAVLAIVGFGAAGAQPLLGQGKTPTVWDGIYSKDQARRGEQAYKTSCGYCHKDDLSGGFLDDGVGKAVALAGPQAFGSSFANRWKDQTIGDMVYVIASTMPKDAPTSLSLETYVDIVTYIFERNEVPAGGSALSSDVAGLREIVITPSAVKDPAR
jgi:mono/diheme cytochrome c family protein